MLKITGSFNTLLAALVSGLSRNDEVSRFHTYIHSYFRNLSFFRHLQFVMLNNNWFRKRFQFRIQPEKTIFCDVSLGPSMAEISMEVIYDINSSYF